MPVTYRRSLANLERRIALVDFRAADIDERIAAIDAELQRAEESPKFPGLVVIIAAIVLAMVTIFW